MFTATWSFPLLQTADPWGPEPAVGTEHFTARRLPLTLSRTLADLRFMLALNIRPARSL